MDAATRVEDVHTNIRVTRLSIDIFMPPILRGPQPDLIGFPAGSSNFDPKIFWHEACLTGLDYAITSSYLVSPLQLLIEFFVSLSGAFR